jgi:DNA-binding transcriptional ArsR family regulator
LPKTRKKKASLEHSVAKAFAHPLRVRILGVLNEKVASPNLLSQELDQSLNLVAYHVRVLEKYRCIELVDTKQRRGATEHFYRASSSQLLSDSEWARFEALEDRHLSRTQMLVDERGWGEVTELLDETRKGLARIEADALKRVRRDKEPGTRVKVEILHSKLPEDGERASAG